MVLSAELTAGALSPSRAEAFSASFDRGDLFFSVQFWTVGSKILYRVDESLNFTNVVAFPDQAECI